MDADPQWNMEHAYEHGPKRLTPCPDCGGRTHARCLCGGAMCYQYGLIPEIGLRGWRCRVCDSRVAPNVMGDDLWWTWWLDGSRLPDVGQH